MKSRWIGAFAVLTLAVWICAAALVCGAEDPPDQIIGVWETVKSDLPAGSTLAFQRGGKLQVRIKTDKGFTPVDATYTLEGDRLTIQIGPDKKAENREVARIVKLTDKELTIKSESGKVEEFKHVAPQGP
jgi:uncharacterized protein (TIGR03066 family)